MIFYRTIFFIFERKIAKDIGSNEVNVIILFRWIQYEKFHILPLDFILNILKQKQGSGGIFHEHHGLTHFLWFEILTNIYKFTVLGTSRIKWNKLKFTL